ncbi:hypothetical protein DRW41_19920 [Neobacillus piezotolerans]|uniref:SPOR domain-containing protein n=1 Tax=Neobacillus piezotolerans TaxID=2259171 RepID=A0A3D8GKS0_9BACI|nr:hypothetical protein [Neobacillus piezotolerans]RDU35050.1 hypothetical protein DRW41_19920 [Neobacillus piezotolerans]
MDKQKNNTIKVKLNNESRPVVEKPRKDSQPVMEPIITEDEPAHEEAAAAVDAGEEAFDWILPEGEPIEQGKIIINEASDTASIYPKQSGGTKRKSGFPNKPALLTIVFAIMVGVGLGAGMLKLVFIDKEATSAINPAGEETTSQDDETKPSATATEVPNLSAFVVQEGIYSSTEFAETARKNLEEKGIPAAILDKGGQAMLLAGIAGSIESAKGIGEQLTEKGIAIYAKEISITARQKENVTAEEKQFLSGAPELFGKASLMSGLAMEGKSAGGTADVLKELNAIDASKFQNPNIKTLYSDLAEAARNLEAYEKSGNKQTAMAAQTHLLNFIAKYQAF